MDKSKDLLNYSMKTALELCKVLDKTKSNKERELIVNTFMFSASVGSMIVQKYSSIESKEEKARVLKELADIIENNENVADFSAKGTFFDFTGETPES